MDGAAVCFQQLPAGEYNRLASFVASGAVSKKPKAANDFFFTRERVNKIIPAVEKTFHRPAGERRYFLRERPTAADKFYFFGNGMGAIFSG